MARQPGGALSGVAVGEDFAGKLQCDGYSAYPAFAKAKTDLTLFGCWAHARRGFFEAKETIPPVTGWILKQMGLLYRWEEQLRQSRAGRHPRSDARLSPPDGGGADASCLNKLQSRYLPQSPWVRRSAMR